MSRKRASKWDVTPDQLTAADSNKKPRLDDQGSAGASGGGYEGYAPAFQGISSLYEGTSSAVLFFDYKRDNKRSLKWPKTTPGH